MKKILLGFLLLFSMNCKNSDDVDLGTIDCTEVACTEQFVTLIVTIKDGSGVLIPLDAFAVTDKDSSESITLDLSDNEWQMARKNGQYPLYDDSFVLENRNTKRTLVFKGFIDNEMVVETEYIVETDCCHVSIVSGDTEITIN